MHDILMRLIDWDRCPARYIDAGLPIIAPGEPTSVLFLLHSGQTRSADGSLHTTGEIISLCEALALDVYRSAVHAVSDCELRVIETSELETAIRKGGRLAWPLSRSIAAEVTQRRVAG